VQTTYKPIKQARRQSLIIEAKTTWLTKLHKLAQQTQPPQKPYRELTNFKTEPENIQQKIAAY
jgi:hypothetical protein